MVENKIRVDLSKEAVTEIVRKSWDKTISLVNKILEAHNSFGFEKFEASINPSLSDMLNGLTLVEFILTRFVESEYLEYDEVRQSLNSKQCIVHIRMLARALDAKDQAAYEECILLLDRQSKI